LERHSILFHRLCVTSAKRKAINAHDIFCIRRVYSVEKDIKFCYTQNYATSKYSEAFVDWVVQKYEEDESFRQNSSLTTSNEVLSKPAPNPTHRKRHIGWLVRWPDKPGPYS
jgi:hypothetical protein